MINSVIISTLKGILGNYYIAELERFSAVYGTAEIERRRQIWHLFITERNTLSQRLCAVFLHTLCVFNLVAHRAAATIIHKGIIRGNKAIDFFNLPILLLDISRCDKILLYAIKRLAHRVLKGIAVAVALIDNDICKRTLGIICPCIKQMRMEMSYCCLLSVADRPAEIRLRRRRTGLSVLEKLIPKIADLSFNIVKYGISPVGAAHEEQTRKISRAAFLRILRFEIEIRRGHLIQIVILFGFVETDSGVVAEHFIMKLKVVWLVVAEIGYGYPLRIRSAVGFKIICGYKVIGGNRVACALIL